jgi:BON domain
MNRLLYLALFLSALTLAYASAQGQSQSQSSQPVQQTSPPAPAQTTPVKPSQAQPAPQGGNSPINVPGGATDASGGGVVGAAGSTTGKTQVPETPHPASEPSSDTELQSQIQNALSKEPTLSGDTVNVRVTTESINITGSVASAREKLTATRIVDSYAGNRKVISHLTISDKNRNAAPAMATRPPQ